MLVAFASSIGETVDQHFGWSKSFYLYEININSSKFVKVLDSSKEPEEEKEDLQKEMKDFLKLQDETKEE